MEKERCAGRKRLCNPHSRDFKSYFWHDSKRIQEIQGIKKRKLARPHERFGTYLQYAWGKSIYRNHKKRRCTRIHRSQRCCQKRRKNSWKCKKRYRKRIRSPNNIKRKLS